MEREYLYNGNTVNSIIDIQNKKVGLFFYFNCRICGELKEKRINSSAMLDFNFICSSCNRKETNIRKYGTENVFKCEEVKKKIKKTNIDKYGVDNINKLSSIREKIENTRKNKYGEKKELIVEKSKNTFIKNYGVDNPQKDETIRNKTKQTNLIKYGVDQPYKYGSNEMKELMTLKYGKEYPMQNKEIRVKATKRYYYDNLYFDSSYELLFYMYLKDNNRVFEYQPFKEDLYYNGHHYTPDFIIDGQIFEIKGEHFFKDGKLYNPYKKEFLTEYEEMLKHFNVKLLKKSDIINIIGDFDTKKANIYKIK